jgi:hypothetical protein
MRGWSRYRAILRGGEAARVERLAAEGRTVEVRDVAPGDRVVVIALGFGNEFWRVHPGYRANPFETRVDGGELIVEDGRSVTDASRLPALERRIERVVYRV